MSGLGVMEGLTVSGAVVTTGAGPGVTDTGCTEGSGDATAVGLGDGGTVDGGVVGTGNN